MVHYANPPILLENVIPDRDEVVRLLERSAPFTPLGGWFMNNAEDEAPRSAMWFQNDWVHDTFRLEGSELFLEHAGYIEAAKAFYDAEVIIPQSIYVNMMVAIAEGGPAHTDNPRFQGRDRTNTPMWLLRLMLWSGLFDEWSIVQATSIWWMNDVEGGALYYWPDGPEKPRAEHSKNMTNTALLGDNHGMFHQVGPVGPFDEGTRRVTSRAELAPVADGSGEWEVRDRGEIRFRAPLAAYRVSVLWKADIYTTEEERRRKCALSLSIEEVAATFNADLAARGSELRFDPARLDDPAHGRELSQVYPEDRPRDAVPSIFDDAY